MPIIARWILALFIAFVAITLAVGNHTFDDADLCAIRLNAFRIANICVSGFTPGLLVAAAIFHWTRKRQLCVICLLAGVTYSICNIIDAYQSPSASGKNTNLILYALTLFTAPSFLIQLILLYLVRFQGKLEALRVATMALFVLEKIVAIIAFSFPDPVLSWLHTTLMCSLLVGLVVSAWCVAFKSRRSAAKSLLRHSIFCPSCNATLSCTNSRECQCPHCHLQLTLNFNKSHCKKCRYPLQGLTSNNCPECGELLVHATPSNPLTT